MNARLLRAQYSRLGTRLDTNALLQPVLNQLLFSPFNAGLASNPLTLLCDG